MIALDQNILFRRFALSLIGLLTVALPCLAAGTQSRRVATISTTQRSATTLAFSGGAKPITLVGPYDSFRVLVEARKGGKARDVSDNVKISVADPKIAVVEDGTIWARRDGTTTLTARLGNQTISVPVVVRDVKNAPPPRFATEVLPVLTKAGCNQGACHGAAQGKGGFKLSLQGYDPDSDYEAITRLSGGRRITPAQPENSLLLRKPTFAVPHRGGKLLVVGSPSYRLLVDWIARGVPAPKPTEPGVMRLEVVPPVRTLSIGQSQRYQVWAKFSDGTRRDVSDQTLFSGSDGTVASVASDGEAKVVGKGEAAVLIRYRDLVATASLISPFNPPKPVPPVHASLAGSAKIDDLVERKLDALGLEPSGTCTDADFLRRTYLDVLGLLPTPDEARAFLADRHSQKRSKLIDAMLQRPEYVDYWTMQWGDILRSSRNALNEKGLYALNRWIRESVAENKPWNEFARELILARGSMYDDGPANFFRAASTPETEAETTAQAFLGVRMQCARCHNHPYEKWKQTQYYQLAAFFARVRTKPGQAGDERIVYTAKDGEVTNPKTHQTAMPAALDATPLSAKFDGDRRQALADWLTGPKNPFFARILVNRVWRHFMGQGLVEPVDDLRVTNPPSNPTLLDWLAQDFVAHGYDLKYLMRTLMRTRTYQRSPVPTVANAPDTRYYSHFLFQRLGAESLLDAVGSATGVSEKFGGYPSGMRATELPDTTTESYFLDLFGRPARNLVCQCERLDAPNLGQALNFMNGKSINTRLASNNGRVAQLVAAKTPDNKIVEELFLGALSRYPSPAESKQAVKSLATAKDRRKEAEDILWALLNSKEFVFNH